ncbi:MAG: hypothetical protein E7500_00525 [Ruminococcus sp.]|nr:hypothetical protein [Ruminococcus sp.]
MNKRKFNLTGIFAFIVALLVLVAVVPINIIFNIYDKNYDMTPDSLYSLSDTTTELMEEVSDTPIEIYFMSKLEYIRDDASFLTLYHTLDQLAEYDNVTLKTVVPDEDPALVESLTSVGNLTVSEADILVKSGNTIKKIAFQALYPYGEDGYTVYAGEELLAGAIRIVTNGTLPKIYFLTGHGEKTINDNYKAYAEMLKATNNYEACELDLSASDAVPEDAAIVFLAGPQTDISDGEKEKLLDFAEKGGAMAFFMAPTDSDVIFKNVEEILLQYEIQMQYNILEETNTDMMLNNVLGEQDPRTFRVDYTPSSDSYTVDLTTEINNLVASSGLIGGISNTRTFTGVDAGSQYIEKSSIVSTAATADQLTGAYSYTTQSIPYGGNETTAEYAKAMNGTTLSPAYYSYNKQNGSKIIAVGTTDVLDSEKLSVSIAMTQQLVQNSLIWLFNSDMDMDIGSKSMAFDYMVFPNADKAESTLRIFTVFPIVIAAFGLIVWLRRRYS